MKGTSDLNIELVDLVTVPARQNSYGRNMWRARFDALSPDKAAMICLNNHQRAYQIRNIIRSSARYWKVPISTRVIHAEPAIHETDGWLLYYWKRNEA